MNAKLTYEQAQEIRAKYAKGGITQLDLAFDYDVTQGTICHIIKGITYKAPPEEKVLAENEKLAIANRVLELHAADHNRTYRSIAEELDMSSQVVASICRKAA